MAINRYQSNMDFKYIAILSMLDHLSSYSRHASSVWSVSLCSESLPSAGAMLPKPRPYKTWLARLGMDSLRAQALTLKPYLHIRSKVLLN